MTALSELTDPPRTAKHGPPGRQRPWRFWRSPEDQPRWARPTLLVTAAVAALLYTWNMTSSGFAFYYADSAKSMSVSWKAMFFGAMDPGATITPDKIAGSFVPQALFARVFGFHDWAVTLPQAIEGVICVLVMYRMVRRWAGPEAGIIAAGFFTFTPVLASMFGHSMEDGFLTFCLVMAADRYQRAVLDAKLRSLIFAGVWVGVGFQAKMMQAWMILPALALGYLIVAPVRARRRVAHLLIAGVVCAAASLSWVVMMTVVPAKDRPYVDGSTNNSAVAMVFGYNGFDRFGLNVAGAVAGMGGGGRRGGGAPGGTTGTTGTRGGQQFGTGAQGTAPSGAPSSGQGQLPGQAKGSGTGAGQPQGSGASANASPSTGGGPGAGRGGAPGAGNGTRPSAGTAPSAGASAGAKTGTGTAASPGAGTGASPSTGTGTAQGTGATAGQGTGAAAGQGQGGPQGRPGGGGPGGDQGSSWLKLFQGRFAPQIGWMYPFAVFAIVLGLWWHRREPRADRGRAGYVMWGLWLVSVGLIFSKMQNIPHTAYMATLAPPLAALSAAGSVLMWRAYREGGARAWALPLAVVAEVAWSWYLTSNASATGFLPWLRWLVLVAAVVGVVAMVVGRLTSRTRSRLLTAGLLVGLAAAVATPVAWSASVLDPAYGGSAFDATAGPSGGGFGGGGQGGPGGAATTHRGGTIAGPGGGQGITLTSDERKLYAYIKAHQDGATYPLASVGWNSASPYILATGDKVLPIGGFSGSVPQPSLTAFTALVRDGHLRYVLASASGSGGGMFGGGGDGSSSSQISTWVTTHCTQVPSTTYGVAATTQSQTQDQGGGGAFGGGANDNLYRCASTS